MYKCPVLKQKRPSYNCAITLWLKHWQAGWRLYLGPADRDTEEPPSGWGSVTMSSSAPSSKKLASASWGCKTSMQMWQHEADSKIISDELQMLQYTAPVTRQSRAHVKHSRGLSDLATVSLTYFVFLFVHWRRWYSEETDHVCVILQYQTTQILWICVYFPNPPPTHTHVILPWSSPYDQGQVATNNNHFI